ncbi:hypothetical protein [Nocardioides dongkuii]|uniref:hypothetical protein n=1 Tax=Nocardioides dongkuii TaxID=2760089 RepID=UPI001878BE28|nr:hypothetical protein [Nocardioides dongkuii]
MDADVIVKVGVVLAALLALWVAADWQRYRRRAARLGRALHLVDPPPPTPDGPPIEQLAATAERLRSTVRHAPPGTPVARLRGWQAAYDDVLAAACRCLDLEHRLRDLPEGPQRDLERERVERLLVAHGLLLRPPA